MSMQYPRYPAYKDSGVEWLGEVPEHWEVLPVKWIGKIINGATPDSKEPRFWNGDIQWFTPVDIPDDKVGVLYHSSRSLTQDGLSSCAVRIAPPNSVILTTRAPVGNVGVTTVPSTTNQGCRALAPYQFNEALYVAMVLLICRSELLVRSNGTTFLELSSEKLGSFQLPTPPPQEQSTIATFLDHQTAKIDALMAEAERSISLMQERRNALISAAVTGKIDVRGLVDA